jgi:hypothetical protein
MSNPPSKIYATGVREPFPGGMIEHGISGQRTEEGQRRFFCWIRVAGGRWLSVEIAGDVAEAFWVDPGDGPEAESPPTRWAPRRLARVPNLAGVETWVERRETGYRVEWREADGTVGSLPVEAACQAWDTEFYGDVILTAMTLAMSKPKPTIVQIARRVRAALPAARRALDEGSSRPD